jgi:hypothetical protein
MQKPKSWLGFTPIFQPVFTPGHALPKVGNMNSIRFTAAIASDNCGVTEAGRIPWPQCEKYGGSSSRF